MSAGAEVLAAGELFREQVAEFAAGHEPGSNLGQRNASRLRDVGDGPRGPRVHFDDIYIVAALGVLLDGELEIDESDDLEGERQLAGVCAQGFEGRLGDAHG